MVLKLGSLIELEVDFADQRSSALVDIAMKELNQAGFVVRLAGKELESVKGGTVAASPSPPGEDKTKKDLEIAPEKAEKANSLEEVNVIKRAGFTSHTISMICTRILGIRIKGLTIVPGWPRIKAQAKDWEERSYSDLGIWALYVAPIHIPIVGERTVILGITKRNQLTILTMSKKGFQECYEEILNRGVKPKGVKFAMLSLHAGSVKDFTSLFPNTVIGRDWNEFILLSQDRQEKAALRDAMMSSDSAGVKKTLKKYGLPMELASYLDFDPKFWRVLRTGSNIKKIEVEISSRIGFAKTTWEQDLIILWSRLRIQYQWNRFPVNSDVLKNLQQIQLTDFD